jgi:hypothetical protein
MHELQTGEANPAGGILGQLLCSLADRLNLDLSRLVDNLLDGLIGRNILDAIVDALNNVLG